MPSAIRDLWPTERSDLLRELWEVQNLSASQCAARLSTVDRIFTRHAIIGRAWRMGLVHPGGNVHHAEPGTERKIRKPKPPQTKTASKHVLRRTINPHQFVWETGELTELVHEILAPPVSLWALQRHHCRWPVPGENGETFYCGLRKVAGSYCATHYQLAYVRPRRASELERVQRAMRQRKRITALALRGAA